MIYLARAVVVVMVDVEGSDVDVDWIICINRILDSFDSTPLRGAIEVQPPV
jgi:hypothetical protein